MKKLSARQGRALKWARSRGSLNYGTGGIKKDRFVPKEVTRVRLDCLERDVSDLFDRIDRFIAERASGMRELEQ